MFSLPRKLMLTLSVKQLLFPVATAAIEPLFQIGRQPLESNVLTEANVRQRVGGPAARLLPNP